MMDLETRINGRLIGHIYILNKRVFDKKGKTLYSVECYRPGREPTLIKFNLYHQREKGAERLTLEIYQRLDKELKKLEKQK